MGRTTDGATALVDTDGEVYEGGIDDFRAHNDLLSEDDEITFNRDIPASPDASHPSEEFPRPRLRWVAPIDLGSCGTR